MAVELVFGLDWNDAKKLKGLTGQAKLAGAKALTFTAKDAQAALKVSTASTFHLRNNWVPGGIRIKAANPGTMNAVVGSIDKYMGRHVFGDDKPAEKGLSIRRTRDSRGRMATGGLLIPGYSSIGQAPKHQVTRRKLSRMEGQRRKPFQIVAKSGHVMIVRRKGKKRTPLEVLAHLSGNAAVSVSWPFRQIVSGVVSARFSGHFERAIAKI